MWTGLIYSNHEKEKRDAAYLKLSPSIFTLCSAPLPVTPQQLTASLQKISHGQIPSHYDEHCKYFKSWERDEVGALHLLGSQGKEGRGKTATVL